MNCHLLTSHFSLNEMIRSDRADRMHIGNMPNKGCILHLAHLCYFILEPARVALGEPIFVSSGYRCEALNRAVNGVTNSQHLSGCAADLFIPDHDYALRLWNILKGNVHVDQLLWEHNGNVQWIHVSYAENPRHHIDQNFMAIPQKRITKNALTK